MGVPRFDVPSTTRTAHPNLPARLPPPLPQHGSGTTHRNRRNHSEYRLVATVSHHGRNLTGE